MEVKIFYLSLILAVLSFILHRFKKAKKFIREIRDWVDTFFVSAILAWLIMSFIIQAFKIPSGSMKDTFSIGDHIFALKFIYGTNIPFTEKQIWPLKDPQRGDIIIFKFPLDKKKDFIKRCVGIPGDVVEIRDKKLYVNGKEQKEPYAIHLDDMIYPASDDLPENYRLRDNFGPITIPEDYYFMMGDNRGYSYDSRFWGPLERKYIKGKPIFLYWPPKRIRVIR